MANPLFGPDVRWMIQENDVAGMKAFCESVHPSTVAETLDEDAFTPEEVWKVLSQTGIREQAAIFEYFSASWQLKVVDGTGRPQMAKLIEQMSHDDRVDLLRRLTPRVAEGLLRLVDEADRRDIATLFRYAENTVGALMTTDYAWLPVSLTSGQAIDRLRQQAPDRETIYYIYILDESTRRLLGIVSLRDLILSDRATQVSDLMEEDIVVLKAADDREKAAEELARYDFLAMPVVDDDYRLVGIITHDDVIDVIRQEATEDLQRQGAVGLMSENYLQVGIFTIWRKRAMWLAILFVAELGTFTAMTQFEDTLKAILVLSLFIPLCLSTGGNSGSQAATLITRAMALGHIRIADWWHVLRHELIMGLLLGLTLGIIAYGRGFLTSDELRSEKKQRTETFEVYLPRDHELRKNADGEYLIPAGSIQATQSPLARDMKVSVPSGKSIEEITSPDPEKKVLRFPVESVTSTETVDRNKLAIVIAFSVAGICIWGTVIGSMLPLGLRKLGVDPAMASSPFVATFVDVTGITIYFGIATIFLL